MAAHLGEFFYYWSYTKIAQIVLQIWEHFLDFSIERLNIYVKFQFFQWLSKSKAFSSLFQ